MSQELSLNFATRGRNANEYRPKATQLKTSRFQRDKHKQIFSTEYVNQKAGWWLRQKKLSPELNSSRWNVLERFGNGLGE